MNKDRHEDETLIKQIQESFGGSGEQLQARMDRIEKSLTSDEFAGAEDRIMSKLMARIAVEEKTVEISAVADNAPETAEGTPEETEVKEEKLVRFGRKKIFLVAALAATFAGVLGVTAIGEKSYFFREYDDEKVVVFNSGKNIADVSSLEEAYLEIRKQFGEDVIALNYIPLNSKFESLRFENEKAIIKVNIDGAYLYFIQWKRNKEASINKGSSVNEINMKQDYSVKNEWLNKEIFYDANELDSGGVEYQTITEIDGIAIYIFGKVEKEEFDNILKNIYFN